MKQHLAIALGSAVILFSILVSICFCEEEITILNGVSNAIANRDYSFKENVWVGKDLKPSVTFYSESRENTKELVIRDKVFTKLDTDHPVIKSTDPQIGQTTEFESKVIRRTDECLVIYWENDFANKFWVATIDLKHKKAIVTQTYYGVTSFGVNVETLDCV